MESKSFFFDEKISFRRPRLFRKELSDILLFTSQYLTQKSKDKKTKSNEHLADHLTTATAVTASPRPNRDPGAATTHDDHLRVDHSSRPAAAAAAPPQPSPQPSHEALPPNYLNPHVEFNRAKHKAYSVITLLLSELYAARDAALPLPRTADAFRRMPKEFDELVRQVQEEYFFWQTESSLSWVSRRKATRQATEAKAAAALARLDASMAGSVLQELDRGVDGIAGVSKGQRTISTLSTQRPQPTPGSKLGRPRASSKAGLHAPHAASQYLTASSSSLLKVKKSGSKSIHSSMTSIMPQNTSTQVIQFSLASRSCNQEWLVGDQGDKKDIYDAYSLLLERIKRKNEEQLTAKTLVLETMRWRHYGNHRFFTIRRPEAVHEVKSDEPAEQLERLMANYDRFEKDWTLHRRGPVSWMLLCDGGQLAFYPSERVAVAVLRLGDGLFHTFVFPDEPPGPGGAPTAALLGYFSPAEAYLYHPSGILHHHVTREDMSVFDENGVRRSKTRWADAAAARAQQRFELQTELNEHVLVQFKTAFAVSVVFRSGNERRVIAVPRLASAAERATSEQRRDGGRRDGGRSEERDGHSKRHFDMAACRRFLRESQSQVRSCLKSIVDTYSLLLGTSATPVDDTDARIRSAMPGAGLPALDQSLSRRRSKSAFPTALFDQMLPTLSSQLRRAKQLPVSVQSINQRRLFCCPVAVRRKKLGDAAATCRCSALRMADMTDLEMDEFMTRIPSHQLIVVVVCRGDGSEEPPMEALGQRLYQQLNSGRQTGVLCYLASQDPIRIVRYDVFTPTSDLTPPALVRRHAVAPGMCLVLGRGGQLLYGNSQFNGYGLNEDDFHKQMERCADDANHGRTLPADFQLRALFSHASAQF